MVVGLDLGGWKRRSWGDDESEGIMMMKYCSPLRIPLLLCTSLHISQSQVSQDGLSRKTCNVKT